MIKKSYTKTGKKCRVTFKLEPNEGAPIREAVVLGDFNNWDPEATPLKARKNGSFSTTTSLESGKDYRFRYLCDGQLWVTDEQADARVPNRFGDLDAVVRIPAAR